MNISRLNPCMRHLQDMRASHARYACILTNLAITHGIHVEYGHGLFHFHLSHGCFAVRCLKRFSMGFSTFIYQMGALPWKRFKELTILLCLYFCTRLMNISRLKSSVRHLQDIRTSPPRHARVICKTPAHLDIFGNNTPHSCWVWVFHVHLSHGCFTVRCCF